MEEAKNVRDDLPVDRRAEGEQGVDAYNGFTMVPGPDRDALLRGLQESEARYRALINATAEIVWVVGRRHIVPNG